MFPTRRYSGTSRKKCQDFVNKVLGLRTRNVRTFSSKCQDFFIKMYLQIQRLLGGCVKQHVLLHVEYLVILIYWHTFVFPFPSPAILLIYIKFGFFFNTLLKNMNTILRKDRTPDMTTTPSEAASILGLGGAFSGADFTAFFATDKSYCLFYQCGICRN